MRFRTPTECQNHHLSWLYWEVKQCVITSSRWERACECSTGDFGQGWSAVGPDQQWTTLRDRRGVNIYEEDIVQRFPESKYRAFAVKWTQDGGWDLPASEPPSSDLVDFEVIGNTYQI